MHKRADGKCHDAFTPVRRPPRGPAVLPAGPDHGRHRPRAPDVPVHGFPAVSAARDSGLVQIQIRSPLDTGPELEGMIRAEYKVDVHVVPVVDTLNEAETLDRVAMQAARTIGPLVDSNAIIGVAWGSTLSAVSRHLTRKITHDSVIVQLNGAGNMQTTGITYASDIMRRFGSAYGARVEQFPVPAFFDHAATKKAMWNERSVQRILELQARMSIAIFGVGSVDADYPSHVYAGGYLDEDDLNVLAQLRCGGRCCHGVLPRRRVLGRHHAQRALHRPGPGPAPPGPAPHLRGVRCFQNQRAQGRAGGRTGHRPDPGRGQRPQARPVRRTGLSGCGAA